MKSRLQEEVKQSQPFGSLEQEAHLNIARTAAVLEHELGEVFRAQGITATQYNVLRILRGSSDTGLCRNEVRDRLIAQVPDATRLLDRLVESCEELETLIALLVKARERSPCETALHDAGSDAC
jgi:hypothetical protein